MFPPSVEADFGGQQHAGAAHAWPDAASIACPETRPLRILIAPDKFKGSLRAEEVGGVLARCLAQHGEIMTCPLSDGGEGFVDTMRTALGGHMVSVQVSDPQGRPITAEYALCGETAIMEMARASGLGLLQAEDRDPWRASTRGTGEMMLHAVGQGAKEILLGIGGSATNDGGVGMAQALGFRFLDVGGSEVLDLPARLMDVRRVLPPATPFPVPVEVACDVENPLLGPLGCTRIYGPQKGVKPEEIAAHEARLENLVTSVEACLETRALCAQEIPGSGAAGGLGYGLMVFAGARLVPGLDLVARALNLDEKLAWADIVITGEGQLDHSSLSGKAPVAVARRARTMGKRVIAFCGRYDESACAQLQEIFHQIIVISPPEMLPAEAMKQAATLLAKSAASALS